MRNVTIRTCLALLGATLGLVGCTAAGDAEPPQPAAEQDVRPSPASRPAEDLERMLLDRPSVPVTDSDSASPPTDETPDLPAEGTMVIDRPARLAGERDGWMVLEFADSSRGAVPEVIRVLPCGLLERMEELADSQSTVLFRVSGEITVFEDHAYLLPRKATLEAAPEPPAEEPGTAPATRPSDGVADRTTSPDEIIGKLLQDQPGKPVLTAETDTDARQSFVTDRLIRVVSDEDDEWHMARFEADNTLTDRPMRLLPCRALARALEELSEHETPPPFYVSGEVMRYKGDTYLLPRKLLRKRDLGRF